MNKLIYPVVAIVAFLGFLIAMAPATTVYSVFSEDIRKNLPGLELTNISGSIWDGTTDASYLMMPPVAVSWQLSALRLVTGHADTHIMLTGDGLTAEFDGLFSETGGHISNLQGKLGSRYLNQITVDYGLDLSGEVQLENTSLSFEGERITRAEGNLRWTGGIVHIETPQQIHTVKLPQLDGALSLVGDNLNLRVTEAESEMIDITVKPDGWASVAVSYAFMALADLPLPGGIDNNDLSLPAIMLEEKVL